MNFVCKADEGEAENIVLLIIVLWWCFDRRWGRVGGVGRKSYSGPAEFSSFSRQDVSRSNKYKTFWHVVSTGIFTFYFHEPLLFFFRFSSLGNLLKLKPSLVCYHFYSQQPRR